MLNTSLLRFLSVNQIIATFQMIPPSDYVLFDADEALVCEVPNPFMPFTIAFTAIRKNSKLYLGTVDGYLCRYQENYGTEEMPLNLEAMAEMYDNSHVYDFTIAVLDEAEKLPKKWSTQKEWCKDGGYFVLMEDIDIIENLDASIDAHIFKYLHEIIQNDSCIRIDSIFIPLKIIKPETKKIIRRSGFTALGGKEDGIYYARHAFYTQKK